MPVNFSTVAAATLAAGGTAQKLSTSHKPILKLYVSCPASNSANIWVGDSAVLASTKRGMEVVKGTTAVIFLDGQLFDLASVYFDGTTNDIASISYITPANG